MVTRYTALEDERDKLKQENARLNQVLAREQSPEKTRAGLIERLSNYIEDEEWKIIRARHTIKVFENTIKGLRQKSLDERKAKAKEK